MTTSRRPSPHPRPQPRARLSRAQLRQWRRQRRREARAESFASRDPVMIGAIGLILSAVLVVGAFYVSDLPVIGGGTKYHAVFSDVGNLQAGDAVRIAGLRVGEVTGVELDNATVDVTFRVKNAFVGDQSTAAIAIGTLLGANYLAVTSVGEHKLSASATIPLARTVPPYNVTDALSSLGTTVGAIDSHKLSTAFNSLAQAISGTSASSVRRLLVGLSSVSNTISENDAQLLSLLDHTKSVSGVLAQQRASVQAILGNGSALLEELNDRRQAIDELLSATVSLSANVSALVQQNQNTLTPALTELDQVIAVLQKNKSNLDATLQGLAPLLTYITNATGDGPWVDGYSYNLTYTGLLHLISPAYPIG